MAVFALLLIALLTGALAGIGAVADLRTSRSASDPLEQVDGYPQRIGFDRPSPRLPDRPGPLAGTLYDNDFGTGRPVGVNSRGELWELPVGVNSLSPDGRNLLTGRHFRRFSALVLHDLALGERRTYGDIGQTYDSSARYRFRYLIDVDGPIRLFSLDDGRELGPRSVDDWDGCPPTWLGSNPVLPTKTLGQAAGSELVAADESRSLVAVHPRLQSSCLQLVPAALSAGPQRAPFGTWTYMWTWYWWQLLLAASLSLLGLAMLLWRRQRRRPISARSSSRGTSG